MAERDSLSNNRLQPAAPSRSSAPRLIAGREDYMRPSDPEPEIPTSTDEVVEQLCLALRDVGVCEAMLPEGNEALEYVRLVQALHQETVRRGIDLSGRLERLTGETGWNMSELLEQCLAFPKLLPRVRER